jgi:phosphatidylethanolamine-binding protein (PEBP) family uncharacterized protein
MTMRHPRKLIPCTVLLGALALALAGCGSSGTTPAKIVPIPFRSRALVSSALPALYTCDGKDVPPPLEWGAVPSGTRELALLIIGLTPALVSNSYSLSIEWAVAGIDPGLHRLPAGKLPAGAHLGSTTAGKTSYVICPKRGKQELYQFTIYAVPPTVRIPPEFTGLAILAEIGAETGAARASARGSFEATYKRK